MANSQRDADAHEQDIKTRKELPEGEIILESVDHCDFCKKKASKYTCPKCNLRYCSIECYKGENHRSCSEIFYKEQVMAELKTMKSNDKDRKKIMEILNRTMQHEDNVDYAWSDDEGVENLSKRMEDIDLETASFSEMYCRLTKKERELFETIVQSGEVEILDVCTPWWLKESKHDGIKEFHEDNDGKEDDNDCSSPNEHVPELIKDIPPLATLLPNKIPNEKLLYNIIELVTLYCFLYRVYNGELKDSLFEILDDFINLSPVLADNHNYQDLDTCIKSLVQSIKRSPAFKDNIDPIRVSLSDLSRVASATHKRNCKKEVPMSILCISELYDLFTSGLMEIKILKKRTHEMRERKILYHRITKKLLFMASWLLENNEAMKCSSIHIDALQKELCMHWDSVNEDKKIVEERIKQIHDKRKLRLIEEL